MLNFVEAKKDNKQGGREGCEVNCKEKDTQHVYWHTKERGFGLVLSCLVSLECTLWEGFFWRMPKQAYTVPCIASHPRGQGAQILCT